MASVSVDQLCVGEDARGHAIKVDVYRFKGNKDDAPRVYLQAGVHGDELQGSLVLKLLAQKLGGSELLGNITLIPSCNPIAQNNLNGYHIVGRYDPIEGDNWNRFYYFDEAAFASFDGNNNADLKAFLTQKIDAELNEDQGITRARCLDLNLQKEALKADIVLDLHTDCVSAPYVYAPSYCKAESAYFGLPYVLLMDNDFGGAMDEAMMCPFWTVSERVEGVKPIQSYTLECGSAQSVDRAGAEQLADNIFNYLCAQGVIDQAPVPVANQPQYCDVNDFIKCYAPYGGFYEWEVAINSQVSKGDVVALVHQYDGVVEVKAEFDFMVVNLFTPQALPKGAPMMKVCRL